MNRLPLSHGAVTELVLYGDTHTPPHFPAAFLGAAQDLGAIPAMMMVPITSPAVQPWAPHDSAAARPGIIMEAWKNAHLVIDMTTDAESFCGDIQIAFGNNVSFSLQGRNDTRARIDVEIVVDHGTLVHPGLR
jgi:hypothetical protein